jgi:polyhydroxybutyrate depolymerase
MHTDGVTAGTYEMDVRGAVRRYLILRPRGVDPATVPTIIDLHGSGSWPEEHVAVTASRSLAACGAVVVVPQAGIPFRLLAGWPTGWAWNVPGSPLPGESSARDGPDDLAFMDALMTRLVEQNGADPRRIHVRGYSGGARLASHLISAMAGRLSSVCCVAGIRFVPASGELPPLLAIHGGLDSVNPFEGNSGPRWSESVESVISQWAVASGCDPTPQSLTLSDDVREARYLDASGFAALRLITVAHGAHSWPGTLHEDHIAQFGAAGSFSASQAHWDFTREVDQLRRRR